MTNKEISAEYSHGFLVLSTIVGNHLFTRRYLGYSKREALADFKQQAKNQNN